METTGKFSAENMADIKEIMGQKGIAWASCDSLITIVTKEEINMKMLRQYEKEINEGIALGLSVTVPHYFTGNMENISEEAIEDSPSRTIHLLLGKSNTIYYCYSDFPTRYKFNERFSGVEQLLENMAYVIYKDSRFVTTIIARDGKHIQDIGLLAGSSSW